MKMDNTEEENTNPVESKFLKAIEKYNNSSKTKADQYKLFDSAQVFIRAKDKEEDEFWG